MIDPILDAQRQELFARLRNLDDAALESERAHLVEARAQTERTLNRLTHFYILLFFLGVPLWLIGVLLPGYLIGLSGIALLLSFFVQFAMASYGIIWLYLQIIQPIFGNPEALKRTITLYGYGVGYIYDLKRNRQRDANRSAADTAR